MTTTIAASRGNAKSAPVENCRRSGKPLPLIASLMSVARALWPSKADMELASRADASPRMARYWLAERYDLSADHLAALLRSDEGLEFLEAIMDGAKPQWWRRFRHQVKLSNIRADVERVKRELAETELQAADIG